MELHISSRGIAERALFSTFGEDVTRGPAVPTPQPLLDFLAQWPGHKDDILTCALHLPADADLERVLGKGQTNAVSLRVHRMAVLCEGKLVGYTLRTDQLGINAIELWQGAHRLHRMRGAH